RERAGGRVGCDSPGLGANDLGVGGFRDRRRSATHASLADVFLDEGAHARIARAARGSAENDGDEVPVAAPNRRDEVEPGSAGIAGLDAVDAGNIAEQ